MEEPESEEEPDVPLSTIQKSKPTSSSHAQPNGTFLHVSHKRGPGYKAALHLASLTDNLLSCKYIPVLRCRYDYSNGPPGLLHSRTRCASSSDLPLPHRSQPLVPAVSHHPPSPRSITFPQQTNYASSESSGQSPSSSETACLPRWRVKTGCCSWDGRRTVVGRPFA